MDYSLLGGSLLLVGLVSPLRWLRICSSCLSLASVVVTPNFLVVVVKTSQKKKQKSKGALCLDKAVHKGVYRALCVRRARAVRKVGCSPPPGVR